MSEFMQKLRDKVDAELEVVKLHNGPEAPQVRTALRVLQLAEEVEEELEEAVVGTARAAELTGWSVDTLQTYAKAIIDEVDPAEIPAPWRGLVVIRGAEGYLFRVASIPEKLARTG